MKRGLAGPVPRLGRVAIVAQALAAIGFVLLLLGAEGVRLPFTGDGDWTLRAAFSDAGGIHSGERTPVLVSGVPEGEVTAVSESRGLAYVTMRLDGAARGVIRADASAAIVPRSALEDMTVEISPGSGGAPAARPGLLIEAAHTAPTTTLDQVLSVLDTDTRTQLAIMVDGLARGLGGHGVTLRAAVDQLHTLLNPALQVTDALVRRRTLLADLVGALAQIGSAAQSRDVELAQALASGSRTLSVTASRQSEIAASVTQLPSTLSSLDTALTGVRTLATPLVPALAVLRSTATALPDALAGVRSVAPAAAKLLNAAGGFARASAGPLRDAASAFGGLGATARLLTPAIKDVEPIVSAVNRDRDGIALLGERFSGVLSTDDANGPILRGLGSFEPFNPADFGEPGASGASKAKLEAQAVTALVDTCMRGGLVACLARYLVPGLPGAGK
jgi:phospholipid/cholesterol/gamma-HCH transport system substrate-binding protein